MSESYTVNPCVVLAIDTARRSGYAIRVRGRLKWSGEVDTLQPAEVREIVSLACEQAEPRTPAVLVLEKHTFKGRPGMLIGLGQARERWMSAWAEFGQPRSRVVSVLPSVWRGCVLGKAYRSASREACRDAELAAARSHETTGHWEHIGPDEAAAILISRWATYAPAVARVLPKRLFGPVLVASPRLERERERKGKRRVQG